MQHLYGCIVITSTVTHMIALPSNLAAVVDSLRRFAGTWAIAGGWAIDLSIGRMTRTHADVDVAVFRDEQSLLRATFEDWQFSKVADGKLLPWPRDEVLHLPDHEIHASTPNGTKVELLLNEWRGDTWVFRRDASIELPMARAIRIAQGIPTLAPEVVLLYKSKDPRSADHADFTAVLSTMDRESRAWLRSALMRTAGAHSWLERL
jgi:hypothetical protein